MLDSNFTELTTRRTSKRGKAAPIYDACLEALRKLGPHSLANHDFEVTFSRRVDDGSKDGTSFGTYVNLSNGKEFTAHILAEVGSAPEGTWMAVYPKKLPHSKLVSLFQL